MTLAEIRREPRPAFSFFFSPLPWYVLWVSINPSFKHLLTGKNTLIFSLHRNQKVFTLVPCFYIYIYLYIGVFFIALEMGLAQDHTAWWQQN